MNKLFIMLFCLIHLDVYSQKDSSEIFTRISESMATFQIDTSAVPNDALTEKIRELRFLKGGFNVNEAMEYKITESRTKDEISEDEYEKLKNYLTNGEGKKWLDNSIIWIYRKHFILEEVEEAIKFYKTSAGKKMANDFPIIMVQSLKAAEMIMEKFKEMK